MKTSNKILMQQARESLRGKWGLAVKFFLIYLLISIGIQNIPYLKYIIPYIVAGPFLFGTIIFTLSIARNQEAKLSQLFDGFKIFWKTLAAYLLMILYIILWSLLLIIPGIIAAFSYSMTFYILADNKDIKISEALKKSKLMMRGNKWKLFLLGLRFIGWMLLCILTLGIGLLWLIPYINVSSAKFYEDIKNKNEKTEPINVQ